MRHDSVLLTLFLTVFQTTVNCVAGNLPAAHSQWLTPLSGSLTDQEMVRVRDAATSLTPSCQREHSHGTDQ